MNSKVRGGMAPARRYPSLSAVLALLWLSAWGCGGNDSAPAPPSAPDGGAPATAGGAVLRFCNTLSARGASVQFTLSVGQPPLQFVANTRSCTPVDGQACMAVPVGDVPYAFSFVDPNTGRVLMVESGSMVVEPNDELLFWTAIDPTGLPALAGGALKEEFKCANLGYADLPGAGPAPADGGAGN
jgi:hypothetical protein